MKPVRRARKAPTAPWVPLAPLAREANAVLPVWRVRAVAWAPRALEDHPDRRGTPGQLVIPAHKALRVRPACVAPPVPAVHAVPRARQVPRVPWARPAP